MAGRVAIGVDPGRTGAVAVIADDALLAAVAWRPRGTGDATTYDARTWTRSGETSVRGLPSAHHLGVWCRGQADFASMLGSCVVMAEEIYVGKDPRMAVRLARFAGALVGPVQALSADGRARWITASAWRSSSFRRAWWRTQAVGAGKTTGLGKRTNPGIDVLPKREAAKRESLLVMPCLVAGLDDALADLGRLDHLTDAAGIARHGLVSL